MAVRIAKMPETRHALRPREARALDGGLHFDLPFESRRRLAPARRGELDAELLVVVPAHLLDAVGQGHAGDRPTRLPLALHVRVRYVGLGEIAVAEGDVGEEELDHDLVSGG